MPAPDYADEYAACRARVRTLLTSLSPDGAATVVPTCPDWTVHDLCAHLAGVASALVNRDNPGPDGQVVGAPACLPTRGERETVLVTGDHLRGFGERAAARGQFTPLRAVEADQLPSGIDGLPFGIDEALAAHQGQPRLYPPASGRQHGVAGSHVDGGLGAVGAVVANLDHLAGDVGDHSADAARLQRGAYGVAGVSIEATGEREDVVART